MKRMMTGSLESNSEEDEESTFSELEDEEDELDEVDTVEESDLESMSRSELIDLAEEMDLEILESDGYINKDDLKEAIKEEQ